VDWTAIGLTLKIAVLSTALLALLALPLSYWLATTRWRFKPVIEGLVSLPLVLPPTVLGLFLLVALGPRSPLGRVYEDIMGHGLAFSFGGVVLASVLYSLPFAVSPFTSAFALVDRQLVEAARVFGAGSVHGFVSIVAPLARNGIVSGMLLAFAHTVGEFGVVLMVGGNIPGVTRTVAISIYDDVQALDYERAVVTAVVLLGFSFAVLTGTYLLQARSVAAQLTAARPKARAKEGAAGR
jgi:molybdate transport system permease protein